MIECTCKSINFRELCETHLHVYTLYMYTLGSGVAVSFTVAGLRHVGREVGSQNGIVHGVDVGGQRVVALKGVPDLGSLPHGQERPG